MIGVTCPKRRRMSLALRRWSRLWTLGELAYGLRSAILRISVTREFGVDMLHLPEQGPLAKLVVLGYGQAIPEKLTVRPAFAGDTPPVVDGRDYQS